MSRLPDSESKGTEARTPKNPLKILIVDDHPIVRQGLVNLIGGAPDMAVSGQCESAAEAMTYLAAERADVAIIDLSLGSTNGLDLIKMIVNAHPGVPMLVLSMHDETLYAERALRAGATGYVMKHEATRELLNAIRHVAQGSVYVSAKVSERMMAGMVGRGAPRTGIAQLTDRERHVLELVGRGFNAREIAGQLGVSIKTIESHQLHLKDKLGLRTGRDLLRFAVGWVESL